MYAALAVWPDRGPAEEVGEYGTLPEAGTIHAASWRASHRGVCSPECIALCTPERQSSYLQEGIDGGGKVYMLLHGNGVGIVSVTGGLIEDLYVLPERQGRGYGTRPLRYAMETCEGAPVLWILENNLRARELYEKYGFVQSGRRKYRPGKLDELELFHPGTQ